MVTKQVFVLRISTIFCMREAVKRPQNNDLLLDIFSKNIFLFFLKALGAIVPWCHRGAINRFATNKLVTNMLASSMIVRRRGPCTERRTTKIASCLRMRKHVEVSMDPRCKRVGYEHAACKHVGAYTVFIWAVS